MRKLQSESGIKGKEKKNINHQQQKNGQMNYGIVLKWNAVE